MVFMYLCRHKAQVCFGTPFLSAKKGGKKRQGAKPPESPGDFVDFLFRKIDSNHTAKTNPYKKGAQGPRGPVGRGTENMRRPKNPGPQPFFLSSVFMIPPGRFS